MEPQIRYCTTEDGVRIAYAVSGTAPAVLVQTSNGPIGWLQYEHLPARTRWIALLRQYFTVARYDQRGGGLSAHDVPDISTEAAVLDLKAVIDRLPVDHVTILGLFAGIPSALAYARRYPERVRRIVAWVPPLYDVHDRRNILLGQLAREQWDQFVENYAHEAYGWEHGEEAHDYAVIMRTAVTLESWRRWFPTLRPAFEACISEDAPGVTCPVLVMARTPIAESDHVARLAAALPDARLVILPGTSPGPYVETPEAVVDAMADFADVHVSGTPVPSPRLAAPATGTAVVLFTDIADSAALTERLGDAVFRDASRALDEAIRTAIREAGGTPLSGKVLGDGVMGVFAAASQAIAAARACVTLSTQAELPLHIGLHAGDVISEADNVYGGAVNIASRICGLCEPGEILVSQTVRDLARTSAGVTFEDRGEHALKGIADPVRVFAVRPG